MKKLLCIASACCLSIASLTAQTENPRGLYRLLSFSYDNTDRVQVPGFIQYNYCRDNGTFLTSVGVDQWDKGGITSFFIENRYIQPLNYTGNKPQGEDGKGIQVFDSDKKKFTLRWYNKNLQNNAYFPLNAFTNEHYSSQKDVSKNMAKAFDIMSMKIGKPANKFHGVWRRRGYASSYSTNGEEGMQAAIEMYKIYTDKEMVIMWNVNDEPGNMYASGELWSYQYVSPNVIIENGNPCIINWLDENSYSLAFVDNSRNTTTCEIWDRCGLPEGFQKIFETNVPINKVELKERKVQYTEEELDEPEDLIGTWRMYQDNNVYALTFKEDGSAILWYSEQVPDTESQTKKGEIIGSYKARTAFITFNDGSLMETLANPSLETPKRNPCLEDQFMVVKETSYFSVPEVITIHLHLKNPRGISTSWEKISEKEYEDLKKGLWKPAASAPRVAEILSIVEEEK